MIAKWIAVSPALNQGVSRYMLETVGISISLHSPYPVADLQVQAWTNLPTRFNSEGIWQAVDIPYVETTVSGAHVFQGSLQPTSSGSFGLTYRIRRRSQPSQVQWMGGVGDNVELQIAAPDPQADWTQRPNHVEVMPGVYVGNFMAATQAETLGLNAVLNMAAELNPTFATGSDVAYQKLSCTDGAQHPIPPEHIQAAITWIEAQISQGRRILIHCRAGIGRSGSIGVAYCYHRNRHWNYEQTLDYIWSKKPDIYPHRQLQASLEQLFPRAASEPSS